MSFNLGVGYTFDQESLQKKAEKTKSPASAPGEGPYVSVLVRIIEHGTMMMIISSPYFSPISVALGTSTHPEGFKLVTSALSPTQPSALRAHSNDGAPDKTIIVG